MRHAQRSTALCWHRPGPCPPLGHTRGGLCGEGTQPGSPPQELPEETLMEGGAAREGRGELAGRLPGGRGLELGLEGSEWFRRLEDTRLRT